MKFRVLLKGLINEFRLHPTEYGLFLVLLSSALILRVWRVDQLLGFYYDQGRDALVIQQLLQGRFILIGPTTGLEGVFLGPTYYYFLAVGYFIGNGSPVIASYYQTFFVIIGFIISFFYLNRFFSFKAALINLFIATFSFKKIQDDRWLSNPTLSAFLTPAALLSLTLAFERPKLFLPLATFLIGLLLQSEAASAFFITISTLFLILIYFKRFGVKNILFSVITFCITLAPQLLFEIRHNFLLTRNFMVFLMNNTYGDSAKSFVFPTGEFIHQRLGLYSVVFFEKLKINYDEKFSLLFLLFLFALGFFCYKKWNNNALKVMFFWFFGILIGFLFYRGNYGRVYVYYFIPIIPVFLMIFSVFIDYLTRGKIMMVGLLIGLGLFFWDQHELDYNYLQDGLDGSQTIALGNQTKAIEYILSDAKGRSYNVDVYVPPVIPYAYDYLIGYYAGLDNHKPDNKRVKDLYTIHEGDFEKPERETKWLKRQDGIGKVLEMRKFGGVTVEKRERIKYDD